MSYGFSNATKEKIDEVVDRLCEMYPNISREDHHRITDVTYDNYFSEEELFKWYKKTSPKLTSKVLEVIKEDIHPFFYRESHCVDEEYGGYVPLAQQKLKKEFQ